MAQRDNPKRKQDDSDAQRDERERLTRPSGPDKAYGGAGYAGPGGFGGGYGGEPPRPASDDAKPDGKTAPREPNKRGPDGT